MIRKFKEEDTTKVMTIWTKGNFKAHDFIEKDYWLENFNRVKNEYLSKSETYVYTEDDEIKRFISILEGEYIGALFVRQDSLREGIGRRLINYCKERYDCLILNVYEKNVNAILFYVAMDFKNKGIKLEGETRRKRIYNGMEKIKKAIISLIMSLIPGLRIFFCVTAVIEIILGIISLCKKLDKGKSVAGIVTSSLAIIITVLYIVGMVVIFGGENGLIEQIRR